MRGGCVAGSRYLEPDGTFPNHAPNPEDKEAMRAGSEAVVQSGSDLGIVVDTVPPRPTPCMWQVWVPGIIVVEPV
jgi:hypothetical protein